MTNMRYLIKVLWGVGFIVLISLLIKLLDKIAPDATVFIHNFLTLIQFTILLWIILILLSGFIPWLKSTEKKITILFLILTLPEVLFTYWLYHPSQIPPICASAFRNYYDVTDRNIIQFNTDHSQYNVNLFYTLRPSSQFIFENKEFSDSFNTNKLGLRDDDNSLHKPDIICLGDSYAMGWGVEQNETFAKLLSGKSGKKVLNAAISSYGTARELKNLYRLDTSNLKFIIIQYCRNDFTENEQFVQAGYSLNISAEKTYKSAVKTHYWNKLWFPGKHFITLTKSYASEKLARIMLEKKNEPDDSSDIRLHQSAVYFADILRHSSINFNKIKVIVIDMNDKELMNNDFLNEVKELINTPKYKLHFNDNLITVPVADLLKSNDYYILDPHLRPSGHQKIAGRLSNYLLFEK